MQQAAPLAIRGRAPGGTGHHQVLAPCADGLCPWAWAAQETRRCPTERVEVGVRTRPDLSLHLPGEPRVHPVPRLPSRRGLRWCCGGSAGRCCDDGKTRPDHAARGGSHGSHHACQRTGQPHGCRDAPPASLHPYRSPNPGVAGCHWTPSAGWSPCHSHLRHGLNGGGGVRIGDCGGSPGHCPTPHRPSP